MTALLDPAQQPPLLLVVSTGARQYREYLLASIGQHYRVHLLMTSEPTWERRHIAGWSVLASTLDAEEMSAAARRLATSQLVSGVLCWDEARILPAAQVAEALGLPGGDPAMILRCRDKHLTRQALGAARVPQPQSVLTASLEDALAAAQSIGYPVVLKPRALAASLGVVRVDNPEQLAEQFSFAQDTTVPEAPRYQAGVLVEEFAGGPEISVDCAVHAGKVFPLFVARKVVGYPPYFEEVGHSVDGADPLLADPAIVAILEGAHAALGFTDGMTHVEIKVTGSGPKVIEVNGRLGGDLIPYLGLRATGIDPGLAAAAVACGRAPVVRPDRRLVGGVRFFYADQEDTVISSVRFAAGGLPAAVDRAVVLAAPGDTVSPPPKGTLWGRIAFATALAESLPECRGALDAAQCARRVEAAQPALAAGAGR